MSIGRCHRGVLVTKQHVATVALVPSHQLRLAIHDVAMLPRPLFLNRFRAAEVLVALEMRGAARDVVEWRSAQRSSCR
jgi:hypothetical protein